MNNSNFFAKIFFWKRYSSFIYLNTCQFLISFNDSIFRLLVAFSLIDKLGKSHSSDILFISGVVFVAPFLIFAMPAGTLADKFPKNKVIVATLVFEVVGILYGVYAMIHTTPFNAYAALFCVAMQSALFLPSKYSILPELVPKSSLSRANGFMTLATYLAIIFGTFFASFFTQITGRNYVLVALFCLTIALLGFISSLQIKKLPVKNPTKKIRPFFLMQVFKNLKLASKYPHLLLVMLAGSFFLYISTFTLLNLIPFGLHSLKISDVQSGYIFLAAAFGIGIGSALVAIFSGKNIELGISIIGAFGTSVSYLVLYFCSHNIVISMLMLLTIGVSGGLYMVPLNAYIQMASPDKERGEIVAASTFLGFSGVMLSALTLGFFTNILHLSAAEGYLVIGLLTLGVSFIIAFKLSDYLSRIFAIIFFKTIYRLFAYNIPKIDFYEPIFILINKIAISKILTVIYLFPRVCFIRFVEKEPFFALKLLYSLLNIIFLRCKNKDEFINDLNKVKILKKAICIFVNENGFDSYKYEIETLFETLKIKGVAVKITSRPKIHPFKKQFYFFKNLPLHTEAVFSEKSICTLSYSEAKKMLFLIQKN